MSDLVTLLVTSYNHARFLDQRMRTLLRQTYEPKEILVVDDNSRDDSRRVLEKYRSEKGVRLVFNEENGGGYAEACNRGVALSRGSLVMIAQSDDFDEPAHVERLAAGLEAHPDAGVGFCRSALVNEEGAVIGDDFSFREPAFQEMCREDALLPGEEMAKFLLISCVIPNLSAALIRKELYEKLNGLSSRYKSAADWDFWRRMSRETDFFYVTQKLNNFRIHRTTLRATYPPIRELEEISEILWAARAEMEMSPRESARFKTNLGFIWANSIIHHPFHWAAHAAGALKLLMTYDATMFFHLCAGFLARLNMGMSQLCGWVARALGFAPQAGDGR